MILVLFTFISTEKALTVNIKYNYIGNTQKTEKYSNARE